MKLHIWHTFICIMLLAKVATSLEVDGKGQVLISVKESSILDSVQSAGLCNIIATELRANSSWSPVSFTDIRSALEQEKDKELLAGDQSSLFSEKVARHIEVAYTLDAEILKVGSQFNLTLVLRDVASSTILKKSSLKKPTLDHLIDAIPQFVVSALQIKGNKAKRSTKAKKNKKGYLKIDNVQDGVICYVDERKVGEYPFNAVALEPGKYLLSMKSQCYYYTEKSIEIFPDDTTNVLGPINSKRAGIVLVAIDSTTKKMVTLNIWHNNKFIGETPFKGDVFACGGNFVLKGKGYQSKEVYIDLETGKTSNKVVTVTGKKKQDIILQKKYGMKLIPQGEFKQGSKKSKKSQPTLTILLSDFYMDSTEVTRAEFFRLMKWAPQISNPTLNSPVTQVNWYNAILYCNERSKEVGLDTVYSYSQKWGSADSTQIKHVNINYYANGFRLPTEAEWEYAYRGNSPNHFFYWGNYYEPATNYVEEHISDVAGKSPNMFGMYNMGGNALEWCNDLYAKYQWGTSVNPTGRKKTKSGARVVRGGTGNIGNRYDVKKQYSYWYRSSALPNETGAENKRPFGFRCVLSQ